MQLRWRRTGARFPPSLSSVARADAAEAPTGWSWAHSTPPAPDKTLLLSFSARVIELVLVKLSKRIITPLILCLLGLGILSNRILSLRQLALRINQNASFHLPVDNATPSRANGRTYLLALPNEGVADLPHVPRHAIEIKTDPPFLAGYSLVHLRFQGDPPARPSLYLLESALNL